MKPKLSAVICLALLVASASAAEKKALDPHPITTTFYITNVDCDACVAAITESLHQVKSVTKVEGLTPTSGYANISFDTHADTAQLVALAIAAAKPVHAKPYTPTLKIRAADYAKDGNAAKIDAVFAKQAKNVEMEATDKAKGDFVLHFKALPVDFAKDRRIGWNPGNFGHAIHDPAPKGLGLAFAILREGAPARPVAKKK